MDRSKKNVEEMLLTKFISNKSLRMMISGISPMDPPDFKIQRYVNKRFKDIGVEITRVLNPNLKQHESAQKQIVDDAKAQFNAVLQDKLVVYVNFSNTPFAYDRATLRNLSNELFRLVKEIADKNRGYKFRVETRQIKLNPVFNEVTVKNDEGYRFENWQPFGAFRVPYIDETWFSEIIEKKEAKIETYPEQFDEKWLLLVANFGHQSSGFQFSNLRKNFKASKFDRIFIYEYMQDEVVKVKF